MVDPIELLPLSNRYCNKIVDILALELQGLQRSKWSKWMWPISCDKWQQKYSNIETYRGLTDQKMTSLYWSNVISLSKFLPKGMTNSSGSKLTICIYIYIISLLRSSFFNGHNLGKPKAIKRPHESCRVAAPQLGKGPCDRVRIRSWRQLFEVGGEIICLLRFFHTHRIHVWYIC